MIELRDAELPADAAAIMELDTSFSTDVVFAVARSETGLLLRETTLSQPLTKRFPLDDLDDPHRPWTFARLAIADGRVCGFVAVGYQQWNRRLTLWHLYVHPNHRRLGIARMLVESAARFGVQEGALLLWLETSNLNVPGIRAYRRLGFELCGADTTLYRGTAAEGEHALFFARDLSPTLDGNGTCASVASEPQTHELPPPAFSRPSAGL